MQRYRIQATREINVSHILFSLPPKKERMMVGLVGTQGGQLPPIRFSLNNLN